MQPSNTLVGACFQISQLLRSDKPILLGLGRSSIWPNEPMPEEASALDYRLEAPLIFIKPKLVKPAYLDDTGSYDGGRLGKLSLFNSLDPVQMAVARASILYLEAELHHANLPSSITSFRTLGLMVDCHLKQRTYCYPTLIAPTEVDYAVLDKIYKFKPVFKQESLVQTFKIVRRFA